jgi:methionine-S-sulfoxide reductase
MKLSLLLLLFCGVLGFVQLSSVVGFHPRSGGARTRQYVFALRAVKTNNNNNNNNNSNRIPEAEFRLPTACLVGVTNANLNDVSEYQQALLQQGFGSILVDGDDIISPSSSENDDAFFSYKFSKATGMLQLIRSPPMQQVSSSERDRFVFEAPRWVPIVKNEENVLVANGWSFLDPDENEPLSAYDVDAANQEGTYQPKWGDANFQDSTATRRSSCCSISVLGYDLTPMSFEQVLQDADTRLQPHSSITRQCLLQGGTDPPHQKETHNGVSFQGSASQSDWEPGIFACAIGGLPLFSSLDLSPSTAASGWLSFYRALSDDHVLLIPPETGVQDQRIEVICAKSRCHLGHYFGPGEGFCINASALNYVTAKSSASIAIAAATAATNGDGNLRVPTVHHPFSWRVLDDVSSSSSDPRRTQLRALLREVVPTEQVALGAGCFWHVEAALRCLPGVVETTAGYAGGSLSFPSYEDVCRGDSGHAEVVLVDYDPIQLDTSILIDCFLTLHDPTQVKAHGKHAADTGQYRSCILAVGHDDTNDLIQNALARCQSQLQRELSTKVHPVTDAKRGNWFWRAEDRHQRHDERQNPDMDVTTLSLSEWLLTYGKRSQSILGSATTINSSVKS